MIRSISRGISRGFNEVKDIPVAVVGYAIKLKDGRTMTLQWPFDPKITDRAAYDLSRRMAEDYVAALFTEEHETGIAHCCKEILPKHADNCSAFEYTGNQIITP